MFNNCVDKWYKCALTRLKRVLDDAIEKQTIRESAADDELPDEAIKKPNRIRFTIKAHVYIGFVFAFVIAFSIGIALVATLLLMDRSLEVVEVSNKYVYHTFEARNYEKDFLINGTGLKEGIQNIRALKDLFLEHYGEIKKMVGSTDLLLKIDKYGKLLETLDDLQASNASSPEISAKRAQIKDDLQALGGEMVTVAKELMRKERDSLDKTMLLFRVVHIYALVFLIFFIAFILHLLGYRVLRTLNSFMVYMSQISSGRQSNFQSSRLYRDEFSDLSGVLDQLVKEYDRQQTIISQSHKLRAVGTLTAGIAHELNNPINNMTLTAHMLLEDYHELSDDECLEMIKDLIDEAGRARLIVRNLLDFARESESIMEPIAIGDVLEETLKISGSQVKLAGVNIELKIAQNLPRIHGDRHQLQQVFLNLLLNALDVTLKGGHLKIEVGMADEDNFVAVKITDFGQGIPDHILHHIFDPFFTTKTKGKGTGLGLSVSQGIIAKHGGHITVSTKQRRGTTFTVKLPITTIPADLSRYTDTQTLLRNQ
ncbi:sensor histidine kinase [Candidatus Magnetominusculus dajiuhuensis]|uniref:sensor histidine kinase n=1 Tax=Candidatus Magnetominusculus dajiuhuensis TaxID=3137712 RepID=UPI003B4299B6